ncbi:TRAP transporter small permease [Muribacter muris]|uniref:TRAP transporter small permease protein n=1 Tax=Muribacter muris TaxID=67855 RepID=A0A4Y9JX06_9PAST|nr:TRAP transporter small permease [Muribacter muris]MBF0785039.1 TRAP transporter small permease [Muribacter muris]MBF0826746.1 TRAP transporter small permease [Muribacter muris]TFV10281.1 TRAP transporter small permease [Muribacter muris]
MNKLAHIATRGLEMLVVLILAKMSILVFLNVVLRYGFNSSISVTEEVSRYLFVWLTFLAAILAFRDNQHVSVTVQTAKLSLAQRRWLSLLTDGVMLYCCYLIIAGGWVQFQLNWHNLAPISNIPTGITFLAGVVAGTAIGILLGIRWIGTASGLMKGEIDK